MNDKYLNPKQLAILYWILWNISEVCPKNGDDIIKIIDPVLMVHGEPNYAKYFPRTSLDSLGMPYNASNMVRYCYVQLYKENQFPNLDWLFEQPQVNEEMVFDYCNEDGGDSVNPLNVKDNDN